MKLKEHYDWMVFGMEPGALLSAAMVARLGLSVCIFPFGSERKKLRFIPRKKVQNPQFLNTSMREAASWTLGQWFDPDSQWILGLGGPDKHKGLLLHCLELLGLATSGQGRMKTQRELGFVMTANTRLEWGLSPDKQQLEWERELGFSGPQKKQWSSFLHQVEHFFASYWLRFPRQLRWGMTREWESPFFLKHRAKDFACPFPHQRLTQPFQQGCLPFFPVQTRKEWRDLLQGFSYATAGRPLDWNQETLWDALHLLGLQRLGGRFVGGRSWLRQWLIEQVQAMGAHCVLKSECQKVLVQKERLVGVQLGHRGQFVTCTGGVLAGSYIGFLKQAGLPFQQEVFYSRPLQWKCTLALTVRREGLPEAIHSRLFWYSESFPIEIEVANPQDYEASSGEAAFQVIYLRAFLPYEQETLLPSYQQRVAQTLFQKGFEIFPGLEKHWCFLYPEFRALNGAGYGLGQADELMQTSEWERCYGFHTLEEIPENLLVHGRSLGYQTPLHNLCLATEESYPFLGSLGPTVAAVEAATWSAQQAGIPGAFG